MKKVILFAATGVMAAFLATSCCKCDKKCDRNVPPTECPGAPEHGPKGPQGMMPGCPNGEMPECPNGKRPECPFGGEITPEKKEICDKFMKFDSLSVDEQKAVLKSIKADIDQREAEMAAKKAEMEQKWANFDNLTVEEQKQLIDMKSQCGKMGPKQCGKPGEGKPHKGGPRHEK